MKNSQLIKLLKTFNPQEIKKFGEFILSPYFNKNKNVRKLYKVIRKAHPDFEKNFTKEKLFLSIFPGKDYNDNTLRLLMHILYENARKFLVLSRIEKDKYAYKEELVRELYDRKLYTDSMKENDKAISELEESKIRDSEYFYHKYFFEDHKIFCIQRFKQEKHEKYITESNTETPIKNLTYYYFSKFLKAYSTAFNINVLYNIDINAAFFEKLFSNSDYELFKDVPFIQLQYNIVMLHKTEDEEYYYAVKDLVQKHEKSLTPSELYDVYMNMENFCTGKIIAGEKHFVSEKFEIQKLDLEKKIYKVMPYMHQGFYKSVLRNATKLKEFDWADNFIESYIGELRPDFREPLYCYGKAYLEAEKDNFEKSLDYLSKLVTDELYLKIDLKLLQARLYYELNWYDVLNSAIDSIRYFLKSNKFIAEKRRSNSSTFINFLSSLNNARLKKDEMKINELRDEIHKTKYLQWKDWFIKKVEELEAA